MNNIFAMDLQSDAYYSDKECTTQGYLLLGDVGQEVQHGRMRGPKMWSPTHGTRLTMTHPQG